MTSSLLLIALMLILPSIECFDTSPAYVGVDRPLIIVRTTPADVGGIDHTFERLHDAFKGAGMEHHIALPINNVSNKRPIYIGAYDLNEVEKQFANFTCLIEIVEPEERIVGCMLNVLGRDISGISKHLFERAEEHCSTTSYTYTQLGKLSMTNLAGLLKKFRNRIQKCTPYLPFMPETHGVIATRFPQLFWNYTQLNLFDGSKALTRCPGCRTQILQRLSNSLREEMELEMEFYSNIVDVITNVSKPGHQQLQGLSDTLRKCEKNTFFDFVDWYSDAKLVCWYKWAYTTACRHMDKFQNERARNKLLFIHVGVACGGTITQSLDAAHIGHEMVHVAAVRPDEILQATKILINVRYPVNRTVSAFEGFLGTNNRTVHSCLLHSVGDYVDYLFSTDPCAETVRRTTFGHVNHDTCSYMGGVRDLLRARRDSVYIVATESCTADIVGALHWLGHAAANESSVVTSHVHHNPNARQALNASQYKVLETYLEQMGEMDLYREIKNLGVNKRKK
mmetsp:Transcript_29713/g.50206  ORF Transcript_29713/g.50206 Transcript_29713/m.50206 type:complete len:509 (-) Transcript_29713:733-2259(-)